MRRRSEAGKVPSLQDSTNTAANVPRLLQDIEALSKSISIKSKPKSLPPPHPTSLDQRKHTRSRSVSDGNFERSTAKARTKDPRKKPSLTTSSSSSSTSSSSIWSWKTLRNLSHIRHRRLDCRFTLHVHSIQGLPPMFNDLALCVHWKRISSGGGGGTRHGADGGRTKSARVTQGVAEFEEVMAHRCSVYGSKSGTNSSAKYESRQFMIWAVAVGFPEMDLGKHRVDLTRLLPLTLEELEDEMGDDKWTTVFKLSGRGRGGMVHVSFGYSLVREDDGGGNKEIQERGNDSVISSYDGQKKSFRGVGGLADRNHGPRATALDDIKVLHEVLPSKKSKPLIVDSVQQSSIHSKNENGEDGTSDNQIKTRLAIFKSETKGGPNEIKTSVGADLMKNDMENECEGKPQTQVKPLIRGGVEHCDDPGFTVVEKGVELLGGDQFVETMARPNVMDKGKGKDISVEIPNENNALIDDKVIEELSSALDNLSYVGSVDFNLTPTKVDNSDLFNLNHIEGKSNNSVEKMSRSLSLDDVTESVASEFLSMLGIEDGSFSPSSESEPASPREKLLKEFQDSLSSQIIQSPRGSLLRQFVKDSVDDLNNPFMPDLVNADEMNWGDDIDLTSIIHATETEHNKATQTMKSKTRAMLLEDAEAEALMREWGLNEKAFENSPPESRCGFGSPIDLPPGEPSDLPSLGEGLGPFIQTKDGGFLRSMNPSLFKNAKNSGSLVMQVSSPVVVPAEMGSGILDIMQTLASIGIEKLSMQASKLMPLEDITGKTMQQVAWEALPSLEANASQEFLSPTKSQTEHVQCGNPPKRNKNKILNSSSSRASDEYVSLEDLAPMAMDKIEALSIDGLRIESGMSDDDGTTSNISVQSFGDISALNSSKTATNIKSLGLEGAAGLQLLDAKESDEKIDGLMGLSLTLDEWMKLDSGIVDDHDLTSDRTSKILAAHHASSADMIKGCWKGDQKGSKSSGKKRWGLLGNNFTVALMVQLRDPLRNYEPVGTPMLSLIQVERVFIPPKPKIYNSVSDIGNSEDDEDNEKKPTSIVKEEEITPEPQFKITEIHLAGLKTEQPTKRRLWGLWGNSSNSSSSSSSNSSNITQKQSGSRWLLATGMGKSNKNSFMKPKPFGATNAAQCDTLWSISSRAKKSASQNPHTRNPNVIFPNETNRLC